MYYMYDIQLTLPKWYPSKPYYPLFLYDWAQLENQEDVISLDLSIRLYGHTRCSCSKCSQCLYIEATDLYKSVIFG